MAKLKLKELREAAGLTQGQLAAKAGLSVKAIQELEDTGAADPRASTLKALASALNSSVEAILGEPAKPKQPVPPAPPPAGDLLAESVQEHPKKTVAEPKKKRGKR